MYGAPFVSKFFLKDYGSGTNQMGGFVGGAPVLQMAIDNRVNYLLSLLSMKWPILGLGGFFNFIICLS